MKKKRQEKEKKIDCIWLAAIDIKLLNMLMDLCTEFSLFRNFHLVFHTSEYCI